jgi:hypothetical protein
VVKVGVLARNGQGCEAVSEVGSTVAITLTTPSLADLKSQLGVGASTVSSSPSPSSSPAPSPSLASSNMGSATSSATATPSTSPTSSVDGTHEAVPDTVLVRIHAKWPLQGLAHSLVPAADCSLPCFLPNLDSLPGSIVVQSTPKPTLSLLRSPAAARDLHCAGVGHSSHSHHRSHRP